MEEALTTLGVEFVNAFVQLVIAVLSIYVVPKLIKLVVSKLEEIELSIGKKNYELVSMFVAEAIRFAQREFKDDVQKMGEKKKAFVVDYIKNKGAKGFDDETLNMMIENAVSAMKQYNPQIPAPSSPTERETGDAKG